MGGIKNVIQNFVSFDIDEIRGRKSIGINGRKKEFFKRLFPCGIWSSLYIFIFFRIFSKYAELSSGFFIFVDWRCWRSWERWPFAVAVTEWRCLATNFSDRLGQVLKKPFFMAFRKLDFTGPKHVAWRYSAKSLFVCLFLKITLHAFFGYIIRMNELWLCFVLLW